MSLFPIYVYEDDTELPEEGNYFVIAANGTFFHKDVGIVKALVKFDLGKVPGLCEFAPPKPKSVPVYVYDENCGELPEDGNYFLVAKNGIYEHKRENLAFRSSDYNNIPNLGTLKAKVKFDLPSIPGHIIWKSLLFFRHVWHVYRAEAAVVLFYSTATKEYVIHCPKQQVSGAGVDYGTIAAGTPDPEEIQFISDMRQKGFNRIGTIHSHCNFSAFHSGTDTSDEADWPDGIHITIGHVDRKHFSLVSSLVVHNNRFQVEPATVISGLRRHNDGKVMGFSRQDGFYTIVVTGKEKELLTKQYQKEIETWMPKVSQFVYKTTWSNSGWWNAKQDKDVNTHVSACVTPAPTVTPSPVGGNTPVNLASEDIKTEEPSSPEGENFLKKVRGSALSLYFRGEDADPERKTKWVETLKLFFRKDTISAADIMEAVRVNPQYPAYYAKKGYLAR